MDLAEMVSDAVKDVVSSGKLKEMVEKNIESAIAATVRDSLSTYGDFGKKIKAYLDEAFSIDLKDLGMEGYNLVVLAVIKEKLDKAVETVGREKIKKEMEKLLGSKAPKTIKLSKLMERFKRFAKADYRSDGCRDEVTIIVDPVEYGSRWINLDPEAKKAKYQCRFRMLINEDGCMALWQTSGIDHKNLVFAGPVYGFEKDLFHLYAAGTLIEVDQTEFDCGLTRYDDEEKETADEDEEALA